MNITEQKILNGIKYFIIKTKNVGRTKLFKLLYFLDFMHFKKYGTSVTGYEYYTFSFGPVPQKLYNQMKDNNLPASFKEHLVCIEEKMDNEEDDYKQFKFKLKNKKIDLEWFSPNELEILEQVAFIFKDVPAKSMTEITHLHNSPWSKTVEEKGMGKFIDYFLALDDETNIDIDTIKERYNLQRELLSDGRTRKRPDIFRFQSCKSQSTEK
jgi:uncharacterized phage-associated protein